MRELHPYLKHLCTNTIKSKFFVCILAFFFTLSAFSQPVISSFSPTSGPVGTALTITGNNFSTTPANNIVFFGAVKANVTVSTATSLTVTAPAGATYELITVTVNGSTGYSSKPFILTFSGGGVINSSSFADRIDFTTDLHPNDIAVRDFDGDGKPDIATANNYSITDQPASISILRNNSSLGLISFAQNKDISTGVLTYAIASADLDGDGKPDLVSSSIVDQNISVFRNTSTLGSISFAQKINYGSERSPYGIAIGDIDGDGRPEIAVVNATANSISIFRNTSNIGLVSFAPKVDFTTALSPQDLAIGDFDGDGKPDIAVTNKLSNSFSVFRNISSPGNISFTTRIDKTLGGSGKEPKGLTVADVDGDNKLDLAIVISKSSDGVSHAMIFRNISVPGNIDFNFARNIIGGANSESYYVAAGDINGDGKPDLALAVTGRGQTKIFQNNSSPGVFNLSEAGTFNSNFAPYAVGLADLDADSKPELITTEFTGDKVSINRNQAIESPIISSFDPSTAGAGTTVNIHGSNFTGTSAVNFGDVPATSFTVVSATIITAVVGSGNSGDISVTNAYGTGTKSGFSFAGAPVISSFTPTGTGLGNTVTITGANLDGATSVEFGGVPATSFTIVSPTTITAIVGTGASGNLSVTTQYGTGTLGGFIFLQTPTVASFTPLSAGADSTVIITGTNFLTSNSVSFGNIPASSFTIISNTQLRAIIGPGASGNVSITNTYGTASVPGFIFIPAPQIASFNPANGVTGTTISITGNNFNGVTEVNFDGIPANSFTIISNTTITAVVGTGATGAITIKSRGGIGSINGFAFVPPPRITSFSPIEAKAGSTVVITGTNLKSSINDNKVTFGSVEASITSITDSTIVVVVPEVTTNKPITLTANRLVATSNQSFITIYPSTQDSFTTNSFKPVVSFRGATSEEIYSRDIDGDGKLDIVAGDIVNKKVSIFRNTSTKNAISFASKYEVDPFWIPHVIAIGDLDGDGKDDLVAGNSGASYKISVLLNKSTPGTLSFAPRIDYDAGFGFLNFVALGDMDGDGRLDIVMRPQQDSMYVHLNKSTLGKINFDKPIKFFVGTSSSFFNDVLINDLDGDKKPEIICTAPKTVLFHNNSTPGNLVFSNPIVVCPAAFEISIDDFDGDGKKDFAIATYDSYKFFIYRNQSVGGSFAFTADSVDIASVAGVIQLRDLKSGDLNGDGFPEIVTINGIAFLVFENKSTTGKIVFKPQKSYPRNPADHNFDFGHLNIADVNGDNRMDVSIGRGLGDSVYVFINNSFSPDSIITAFTPTYGTTGTVVTITGKNLSEVTGVSFGEIPAASFTVNSSTNVTAVVGTGASGNVSVTTPEGTATLAGFTFIPAPTITSFTPTSAASGATVTITGTNFIGATAVSFGGIAATSFTVNSSTSITGVIGVGASGDISVTTPGGTATLAGFTFIPAPTITSFTPTSAGTATSITITGTNLTGATAVSFGGITATSFTINSATSITAVVGTGASGNVSVTTPGGVATLAGFTFTVVTAIDPVSANSLGIRFYPNPTTGSFVMDTLKLSDKWETLEIFDTQGKKKLSNLNIGNKTRVNVNVKMLSSGLYIAILMRKNGPPVVLTFLKF